APRRPLTTHALPVATIPGPQYGLKTSVLKVHTASEPKHLAVTGSSALIGAAQPRSAQGAAESYAEDLFQRGHVDVGKHAHPSAALLHPFSFKTHRIVEKGSELMLQRLTFDCGLHFAFDQAFQCDALIRSSVLYIREPVASSLGTFPS